MASPARVLVNSVGGVLVRVPKSDTVMRVLELRMAIFNDSDCAYLVGSMRDCT